MLEELSLTAKIIRPHPSVFPAGHLTRNRLPLRLCDQPLICKELQEAFLS